MCGVRRCWSSVGLLVFALLGVATASHAGRPKQHDSLHWVAKAQVTAHPLGLLKRDEGTCQTGSILCPASLSGGCCPSQYECHTDNSCYATTAGPQTACGLEGFFQCAVEDSGGCCPVGMICRPEGCLAPAGVTNTFTSCPVDYFLCPQSVNYGCCRNGMGCAVNECYTTTPVTSTAIQVITTTSGRDTITTTRTAVTIATPTPPSGTPTNGFVPKFIPTSVPKTPQIPGKSTDGGLTTAQLGGIVGGVVALLVIVVVATILIIRHLKRVTDAVESRKDASSAGRTKESQSQARFYGGQLHIAPGDDNQSIDPLMVTPNTNTASGSGTGTPQIGGGLRDRSDSETGFSPLQTARGDSVDASGRHTSIDSGPAYFDLPPRVANVPGARPQMNVRGSTDTTGQYSQYTYTHWRQTSNASELSGDGSENGGGVGSPLVPELDSSGAYAELPGTDHDQNAATAGGRSRSGSGVASPRVSFGHNRRRSESNGQRTEPPSAAPASAAAGFGPLDVVSESTEIMHGYYGPRDQQAGQTAAGLNVEWDISSPVAAAQPLPRPIMIPTHPAETQLPPTEHPQGQQYQYPQDQQHQHPQEQQQHQYPQEQQHQYQQQPQQQYTPGQLLQQYQFPPQPPQQQLQQQHHQQQQSPQPGQYPYPPQPPHSQ